MADERREPAEPQQVDGTGEIVVYPDPWEDGRLTLGEASPLALDMRNAVWSFLHGRDTLDALVGFHLAAAHVLSARVLLDPEWDSGTRLLAMLSRCKEIARQQHEASREADPSGPDRTSPSFLNRRRFTSQLKSHRGSNREQIDDVTELIFRALWPIASRQHFELVVAALVMLVGDVQVTTVRTMWTAEPGRVKLVEQLTDDFLDSVLTVHKTAVRQRKTGVQPGEISLSMSAASAHAPGPPSTQDGTGDASVT